MSQRCAARTLTRTSSRGPRRRALPAAAGLAALVMVAFGPALTSSAGTPRDFGHPASSDTSQQSAVDNPQRHDTPTDPDFDKAEPDDEDGATATDLYDERFDLFGFPSQLTRTTAQYLAGPRTGTPQVSGFNAAGAWKATRGDSSTVVAILDTGIRWDRDDLRRRVHLNTRELPLPEDAAGSASATYDRDGSGQVDVDDWALDPRVHKAGAKITGLDLIHAFSDGSDADGNGYVDDIAGWNFFDNTNDPTDRSSYFAAANHGSGRAENAVEEGDAAGGLGVCPRCQFVPLRTWDTFVSDANTFAMGIVYAADNGVAVVEGANGSIYHSSFAEAAVDYAYRKGAVTVFSGDDLNTANHNFPGNYNHTILVQGTVPDSAGLGTDLGAQAKAFLTSAGVPLGSQVPVTSYFRGANTTQFGGHSSIAMEGATGSENTGKAAGAAALVISAAKAKGVQLRPDEVREILEQTAEDVLAANTGTVGLPDQAQPGWDVHFGYGRADVGKAVTVAGSGALPPEAYVGGPDWYAPVTGDTLRISGGLARARTATGGSFTWKLEWGPGLAPSTWTTASQGSSSRTVTNFGTIDLRAVRAALAAYTPPVDAGAPVTHGPLSDPKVPSPFAQQFAIRLTVAGEGVPTPGVDRKVLTALDDGTLLPGQPRDLGAGGEAAMRYADLDGDGTQELVVPTEDGLVHAFRRDGSELPGWPVRTQLLRQSAGHEHAPGIAALSQRTPPREPPRGVVIADLDGDGTQEVIDSAGTHVYVWEPDGSLRPGFPVASDLSYCRPELEVQPLSHPKCGFLAGPALGRLEGGSRLDIVLPALDGHLYAWRPDGTVLPGYPRLLQDTSLPVSERMLAESINEAAVSDLDGDGKDDVVVATNEAYGAAPQPGDLAGGLAQGFSDLLAGAAGGSTRLYAIKGSTGAVLPGWPVKLNGAIQSTLPLIGPGHDPAVLHLGGAPVIVASSTGGALAEYGVDGTQLRAAQQNVAGPASDATDRSGGLNLFESAVIGDLTGTGPALVKYELSLGGVANLALAGQNVPYNHLIGAWDAQTGVPLPAFPRITDDYQFLSSSTVAKLDPGSPAQSVLAGTGLGLLHAYDGLTGLEAPGFPKTTGGWLYAPAAVSDDGRIAAITREGYLYGWTTSAARCQSEWPAARHDPQGSADYDNDGTPPGPPLGATATALGDGAYRLAFTSPGDDGRCGTPQRYRASSNGSSVELGPTTSAAGTAVSRIVRVPAGSRSLRLFAADEVGNTGPAVTVALPAAPVRGATEADGPARGAAAGGGGTGSAGGTAADPKPGGLAATGLPTLLALTGLLALGAAGAVRRRHRA